MKNAISLLMMFCACVFASHAESNKFQTTVTMFANIDSG